MRAGWILEDNPPILGLRRRKRHSGDYSWTFTAAIRVH